MKKLKVLSTAVAFGLAAFSFATAQAADNEYIWSNGSDNRLWSDAGNWLIDNDPRVTATTPPSSSSIVYFADHGTYPADMVLDQDFSIGNLVCWSSGEKHRRFSGGHALTVLGTISSSAVLNRIGLLEVSGEGTQLLLSNTTDNTYTFRESSSLVTNNAKIVVSSKPLVRSIDSNSSKHTIVGFTAIDGGVYEFAKFDLQKAENSAKTVKTEIRLVDRGVMKINGTCSIGDGYNATEFYISGAKPSGGFLQAKGDSSSLGAGINFRLTPELEWADGTDVGVIAYTGGGTGYVKSKVNFHIDLARFQSLLTNEEKTFCLYSSNQTAGKTNPVESKYCEFLNADGLEANLVKNGNNLYVTVKRIHLWSDWEIVPPTRSRNGRKCRHCLDDGCTASETKTIENSKLPGDYLQLDTVGWFETTYAPHLKNTTIDFVTSLSTNAHGRSLALAGDKSFFFVFADCSAVTGAKGFCGYFTDETGSVTESYISYTGKAKKLAYTFGGGKFVIDGVTTTIAESPKDGYADGAMSFFKYTQYQLTAGVKVYSVKVTERIGGKDVVKMWLVPGLNGTKATLFDLVSESYLTSKCKSGKTVNFTIGKDPSGLMIRFQ